MRPSSIRGSMPANLSPLLMGLAVAVLLCGPTAPAMAKDLYVNEAEARISCPPLDYPPTIEPVITCPLEQFGAVVRIGGHVFLYGMYAPNGAAALGTRVVIYEREAPGRLRVVAAIGQENVPYDKPRILRLPGRILLQVPGSVDTAVLNEEELFAWRGSAWVKLDTTSWQDDLERRLHGLQRLVGRVSRLPEDDRLGAPWPDRRRDLLPERRASRHPVRLERQQAGDPEPTG
jgi:hypothetical protein